MEEIRLGPIEWGVVTAHHPWGMGVRLEESGNEGVIVLDSIHDDFLRCNGEYWPEIGERIRVRRYIYRSPDDEVRLIPLTLKVSPGEKSHDLFPLRIGHNEN